MIFPSISLLLASLLLAATSILFYWRIKKGGVEKPNVADMLSLAAAVGGTFSINYYMCVERACINGGIFALFCAAPVALGCLAAPPGRKGRASFTHRFVSLAICFATGLFSVLTEATK